MKYTILVLISIFTFNLYGQNTVVETEEGFSNMIDSYLSYSVPLISVGDLTEIKSDVILLDAREENEYIVSHIPGAVHVGYDKPKEKVMDDLDKSKTVVVYCSIGYRSEKIGERLQQKGFRNVLNLYGSIFEWVNQGNTVVSMSNEETKEIHTYDKKWGKWMTNKNYKKVY